MKENIKWYQRKIFLVPLAIIVILGVIGASAPKPATDNKTNSSTPAPLVPQETVTMENFNKVATGLTKAQVDEVFGKAGELMSESEVAGYKSAIYTYKAGLGANATITFSNDKVMSKAQFGLK